MTFEVLAQLLLSRKGAVEDYPFGPQAAVYKVAGKMFALVAPDEAPLRLTLKCDPIEADFLRSTFAAIRPGYHMNKQHWNTITLDGSVPQELLHRMINSSYALVVKGLSRAEREQLG
jgi:predicted DNA-binding protein (MmcQ/YjbR family)